MAVTTQRELAELLGVSAVAVSRALRGKEGVSEALRRRVHQAAALHGLADPLPVLSGAARHGVVGVLVPLSTPKQPSLPPSPFGQALLGGIREALAARGSEAAILDSQGDEWPRLVARGDVDGVVVPALHLRLPRPTGRAPVPAVYCFLPAADADVVSVDDFAAGELLGAHLGELGHRRVVFIGPRQALAFRRAAGLDCGLGVHGGGVPRDHRLLSHWRADGSVASERMAELWARAGGTVAGLQRLCTAIVGYNDAAAGHIRAFLREHGVRVPEDVSVAGVDGVDVAAGGNAGLTTVELPLATVGAETVNLLYWRLETPRAPWRNLVFTPILRPGTTTGPASPS